MYLGQAATAIYFQDVTQHVRSLKLESKVLTEKNRNDSLESYTSTISHEFRTPLATSLMFLENLLNSYNLQPEVLKLINLIISQLTLLLCLVNDVMDMKLIERGEYEQKKSPFKIKTITDFICAMFAPHAALVKTRIETQIV